MSADFSAAVDPDLSNAFRQAMRSVASAVYLITARGPEGDVRGSHARFGNRAGR